MKIMSYFSESMQAETHLARAGQSLKEWGLKHPPYKHASLPIQVMMKKDQCRIAHRNGVDCRKG